jgi:hypothetical protein
MTAGSWLTYVPAGGLGLTPIAGVMILDEEGILVEYEKKRLQEFVRLDNLRGQLRKSY